MLRIKSIKRYIRQILAFIERDIYLSLRIKSNFFSRFISPIVQLFIFIFIFGAIFNVKKGHAIGYWSESNYTLFLIVAFCIQFSKPLTLKYKQLFINEKYWKTLSAIMVAPVNRFTLLLGILISELIVISIPFLILLALALILYPIPLFNILLILIIFFSIFLIFSAFGLMLGAFAISNEEYVVYLDIFFKFLFMFSCINYPKEIFPDIIQSIIILNPLYYIFDILRLTWYLGINYEEATIFISPLHIIMLVSLTILTPIISLYLFNRVYKKYGITGY